MIKETQTKTKEKLNIEYESEEDCALLTQENSSLEFDLSSLKFSSIQKQNKKLSIEELIEEIENLVKEKSPLYCILNDLEKLRTQPDNYEVFKFRSLVVFILAESDIRQLKIKKFYESVLKEYAFNLEEMTNFSNEDFQMFFKNWSIHLGVRSSLKHLIKILNSKFGGKIPESFSDLKMLGLKNEIISEFHYQLKGFHPKEESIFIITYGFFRLANRLGWVDPDTSFADSHEQIQNLIPTSYVSKVSLINLFSNFFCISDPKCYKCPIKNNCEFLSQITIANKSQKYKKYKIRGKLPLNLIPKSKNEKNLANDSEETSD